ncbi:MAG: DnaJ domain-containing protein [Bacteroidota bacterium]|nr:DnaJ domain-containing protein [Candidatus Kapabacteria bacterium]MDW8219060.1 DnaJ domain-containing protein [Bacteroidota bacterium]
MGQLWDRIRRIGSAYLNDLLRNDPDYTNLDPTILEELRRSSSSHTRHSVIETEEERLKRLIDEAANSRQSNAKHQHQSSSHKHRQASPRYNGMSLDEALRVLGLPSHASTDDIKRQYKKLMMQYHPDRVSQLDYTAQQQAREKAQRINAAYEVIKHLKSL